MSPISQHRSRMRVPAVLALLSMTASVLFLWRPDWIEATFGFSPDRGAGHAESLIAGGLISLTIVLGALAARGAAARLRRRTA